jgi:hypothetical protein
MSDSSDDSTASCETYVGRKSTKPALLHFKFDDFADLPSDVDIEVRSDEQTDCNGNLWSLELFPGGESPVEKQGFISLYLCTEY